jgi:methionine aminopeptidase
LTSTAFINGSLIVGSATTSSTLGLIRASNDVIAFASSDERLKENVVPITNSIEKINQIGGYEYDWIPMEGIHENTGHDIGVIAQEIEKVLPEIVTRRENGYLAVKYERIVALLIECVKEQQKQITNLENKINKIIE